MASEPKKNKRIDKNQCKSLVKKESKRVNKQQCKSPVNEKKTNEMTRNDRNCTFKKQQQITGNILETAVITGARALYQQFC